MSETLDTEALLVFLKPVRHYQPSDVEAQRLSKLVEHVPACAPHLESWLKKAGCGTCRRALATVLADNPEAVGRFIDEVDPLRQGYDLAVSMLRSVAQFKAPPRPASIHGSTHEIDDTPEAWAEFSRDIRDQAGTVSGFSILALGEGRIRVYFI